MKKLIVIMLVAMSMNVFALDIWVKGGLVNGVGSDKIEYATYTVGAEISQNFLEIIDLGVGAHYVSGVKFKNVPNISDLKFDIIPVYAFAKWHILPIPVVTPYLVARLGKDFIVNDDTDYRGFSKTKGKYYAGVGAGVEFLDNFQAELIYSVSKLSNTKDISSGMISATVGIKLF